MLARLAPMSALLAACAIVFLAACGKDDGASGGGVSGDGQGVAGPPEAFPVEALDSAEAAASDPSEDPDIASRIRDAVTSVRAKGIGAPEPDRAKVISQWLQRSLSDGAVEDAARAWERLRKDHEGALRLPDDRRIPAPAVAAGVVESSSEEARRRMEGSEGDRKAALRAIESADAAAPYAEGEERDRLRTWARSWVTLDTLATLEDRIVPHGAPRVLAVLDDFVMGEAVVQSVLERWAGEGKAVGLRVGVLPVLRGEIRVGIRRVPADSLSSERAHVVDRLKGTSVVAEATDVDEPSAARLLGLPPGSNAILVADATGRIVARLSGRNLDPRALDAAVQRLVAR